MKKDGRSLKKQVQEKKRRMSIKFWKQSLSTPEIAEPLEGSIRSVQRWISAYKSGGISAFKTHQQGPQVER
ncbi:hypothetical protein AB835_10650 [Candidatus Endobugula sertula]|uniref:Helix-turn-helix domain-containing protein n=1 Tax=Candidatus Endobugula sertula TaxID=62101 RepID=A0A1D2QNE7_9GAMM|nr:hypothetical protein AB835_10650 [Candidatus Endobugula sertula]